LPVLTERVYLGGLGREAPIEHAAVRLANGQLAGRPLAEWSDADLADYCRRFNVGWVVCRSPAAVVRFRGWPDAEHIATLPAVGELFVLNRPRSYFLVGQGRIIRCDQKLLTLTDLTPVEGRVVLSFHHHTSLLPSIDRVLIEKEPHRYGTIPFIRLRLPGPMTRLTIQWRE
jgi:hypothetical protein